LLWTLVLSAEPQRWIAVTAPPRPTIPRARRRSNASSARTNTPAQRRVVGERVAQPMRQGQHPLAHRQVAEDAVGQVRGEHRHAPAAAGGANPPPPAGEGDQDLARAAAAAEAGEAAGHDAAAQKGAQLALDEARQPRAAAALTGLGEKGLEVLAHHALQNAALGVAAHAGGPAAAAS
jgi:hypothetical protein